MIIESLSIVRISTAVVVVVVVTFFVVVVVVGLFY